jgi:hypothetical protein
LVCHSAWILIVTGCIVRRIFAPSSLNADVVGARVLVITLNGITYAGTSHAVVSHGAGVTIFAGTGIKDLVYAPFGPCALVFGAIIVVVAEVDVVAIHQVRFIHFIVAVIVQTVASLSSWNRSITD